jgi:predicted acylesterase/phospholipase RssA
MADAAVKGIEIGVVLQGGGALGAYECGGMAALLELMDIARASGRAIELKAVTGVSIGAINAACVVGAKDFADSRKRIEALWDDLTLLAPDFWPRQAQRDLSLFGLPGFYWPRSDLANVSNWTSYYDTSSLRATLEKHVNFVSLNDSQTVFVIGAVDVESGEITRFANRSIEGEPPPECGPILPDHILASSSLPPQFPWTTVKRRHYWDGGLVDNAPLGDAIDAFSHGKDVERVLVVMDVYPLSAPRPRRMTDVNDRVHELCFGNRVRQDHQTAERINAFVRTIDELAALVPDGKLDGDLKRRVDWARDFKTIEVIDIDMQSPTVEGRPRPQHASDGEFGLRDFSAATVRHRRDVGYRLTREKLMPKIMGAA